MHSGMIVSDWVYRLFASNQVFKKVAEKENKPNYQNQENERNHPIESKRSIKINILGN